MSLMSVLWRSLYLYQNVAELLYSVKPDGGLDHLYNLIKYYKFFHVHCALIIGHLRHVE